MLAVVASATEIFSIAAFVNKEFTVVTSMKYFLPLRSSSDYISVWMFQNRCCLFIDLGKGEGKLSLDKKNQLDVTICILYFSSNSCSTCFGQPCAHHQELTTA